MTQPQQPFVHISEPWPTPVGCVVYGPVEATVVETQEQVRISALEARVTDLERRLADMARENRA